MLAGAEAPMTKTCVLLLVLGAVGVGSTGCVAVAAGAAAAGTVQYLRNESSRAYAATPEATWSAAFAALRDEGYPVDPSAGRTAPGDFEIDDVELEVRTSRAGATLVTVRVGTFDTRAHGEKARRILDGIATRLGR